jgi:8-oxo-dGTP diphosphatase
MRTAINALCIRDSSVLLVLKRSTWILPGGKPEAGETDLVCLARENGEELPKAIFVIDTFYGEFTSTTPHSETELTARVYLAKVEGDLTPSAEISDARFFELKELSSIKISQITKKILDSIVETGHLS